MHPLDPLNAPEFCRVRAAISKAHGVGPGWRFASIELREPAKQEMLSWQPGEIILREAIAVVWNRSDGKVYRAIVRLNATGIDEVTSWQHLPGQNPNMTLDEWQNAITYFVPILGLLEPWPSAVSRTSTRY